MHLLSYIHSICSESFLMLPVYSHPTHTYHSQHVSKPPAFLWKSGSSVPCPPLFSIHFLMFSPPPSFIICSFLVTICKWVCLQCVGDSGMTLTSDPSQCHPLSSDPSRCHLQCGQGPSPHFVTPTWWHCGWHRDESEDSVGDTGMGLKTSLQDLQGLTAPLLLPALHFHPVLLHRFLLCFQEHLPFWYSYPPFPLFLSLSLTLKNHLVQIISMQFIWLSESSGFWACHLPETALPEVPRVIPTPDTSSYPSLTLTGSLHAVSQNPCTLLSWNSCTLLTLQGPLSLGNLPQLPLAKGDFALP